MNIGVFLTGLGLLAYSTRSFSQEKGEDMQDSFDGAKKPRGIRNANPGNIEYQESNKWLGQVGSDGRYAIFSEPVYGIRAISRTLDNYAEWYGLATIEGIIDRWAPPIENITGAYVNHVAQIVGKNPNEVLEDSDRLNLIKGIIKHENGVQPYDDGLIFTAIEMARA